MITNTVRRKRRQFDEDADWLPQKDRLFVLKQPPPPPPPPPPPHPSIPAQKTRTTDKEGLDRAYKTDNGFYRDPEGTLHVAGTRGGLLESDWIENYKVYGPGLVNKLGDMLGKLESGKINGSDFLSTGQPFDIESTVQYKALNEYMKDNPNEVKNFTAHSKGASVVETWMQNNPSFTGHARFWGKPHIDVLGSEKFKDFLNQTREDRHEFYTNNFWGPSWLGQAADDFENKRQDFTEWLTGFDNVKGMKEKHQLRITGPMDPVTVLDNSATEITDPTWVNHLSQGGGHYYGNIADLYAGFNGADGDGYLPNTAPPPPPPSPTGGIILDVQKSLTQPWNDVTPVTTDPSPQ